MTVFQCGYCGSTNLRVKDGNDVSFNPNHNHIWTGGDNPYVFRYLIQPKIICESCGQVQDKNHIGIWGNKLGFAWIQLEDL